MIILTADGSNTIYSEAFHQTYHSVNGAITETRHVFLRSGLEQLKASEIIRIFEFGFGTGLNAIATLEWQKTKSIKINYHTLEAYPISSQLASQMRIADIFDESIYRGFMQMHLSASGKKIELEKGFEFRKYIEKWENFTIENFTNYFDLVYFDAFSPDVQPELWKPVVFKKIFEMMHQGGILVTYCAKGEVRRNMKDAGFIVERIPGPPGKREILRAKKV
jgi:tRNA U34 5-methylaminomethyl-2-thiouridine-forming methyltransferase MnmC